MKTLQVIVRKDSTVEISCPGCKTTRTLSIAGLPKEDKSFIAMCSCNEFFRVELEFRTMYRKETSLRGVYVNLDRGHDKGRILVNNLSMNGAQITIRGSHLIREGHNLQVKFRLHDAAGSVINKKILVKSVQEDIIGCEFAENTGFDRTLALYLIN